MPRKPMIPIPVERAYDMFLLAEAYRASVVISLSTFRMDGSAHFKYVVASNSAMSLELYFKCLLLSDGVQPEYHHDLRGHFKKLSPINQQTIRENHKHLLESDPATDARIARIRQDGENQDEVSDFDTSLASSALAFVQCRYPFDPNYGQLAYLAQPIADATRKTIVDRDPGWDQALCQLELRPDMPARLQAR